MDMKSMYCNHFRYARIINSSSLFVHMYQHGSHWTDNHDIWFWVILWQTVKKKNIWLKSDKNIVHITLRPNYVI